MRDEAEKRIGTHYPKATLQDGTEATVIAWIWARTVTCPNPACGIEMPLVRSWWLGKKKGKEAYVIPRIVLDDKHPSGKRVEFEIGHDETGPPAEPSKNRQGATCVACHSLVSMDHIKQQGRSGNMGVVLLAVVAEGDRRRVYLPGTPDHRAAFEVTLPDDLPDQELGFDPRNLWTPAYGLTRFADLFTNRQLLALATFSDLVAEARALVLKDAIGSGMPIGAPLEAEGNDAAAYADAIATYLSMVLSKMADRGSSIVTWFLGRESTRNTFARQAIPMTWDFVEPNQFASGTGSWRGAVNWTAESLAGVASHGRLGVVQTADASTLKRRGRALISTDPPYYDNIAYSDLSDFFYVWLRRSLRDVYPELLSTLLVPKAEELVANPYRHDGKNGARTFFEKGFRKVFARARDNALDDYPITVYYAFKQSESSEDGEVSSGWETLLDGMMRSGWSITATWPMRSELSNRMLGHGTNALASSIVLALRPRPENASTADRRGLIAALQTELPQALRELQQGRIAPVDLPQAAIGPGMAVFSRYSAVIEADGSPMTVRSALARINEILDQVLNEQEGDFDAPTRFAIAWYRQHGYKTGKFGDANNIANARNTTVEAMDRGGILTSAAGKVTLLSPAALPADYDPSADEQISAWEVLHHMIAALERRGVTEAAQILAVAGSRTDDPVSADLVKELVFLLFPLAEKNGWTQDALAFNTLATAWPEIVDAARDGVVVQPEQASFDLEDG